MNYWSSGSPKSRSRSNSNNMTRRQEGTQSGDRRRRGWELIVPDREDRVETSPPKLSHLKRSESVDRDSTSSDRSGNGRGWSLGNGKSLLEQLLQYKGGMPYSNQNSPSDSTSTTSSHANSHASGDMVGKLPYESEYEYFVRKRRISLSSNGFWTFRYKIRGRL